jgi:hypothetical protein
MAIVRLGGRTPDAEGMDPQFFGPGGPVKLSARPETAAAKKSGFGRPMVNVQWTTGSVR